MGIFLHQGSIEKNHDHWNRKPLLQLVYQDLYRSVANHLSGLPDPKIVELGSGLGNIQLVLPDCLRTDLFPYPWIDQIENAYNLSFEDESVSDLILSDVFHHLKYPGTALRELHRVLRPGGRVILLEPCLSALGLLVYGLLHVEPIAITKPIQWFAPADWSPDSIDYYAAQGNASRIFLGRKFRPRLRDWHTIKAIRLPAISYAASGGYSKPQLYPTSALPLMKKVEKILDPLPALFATRLIVILQK